MHALKRVLTSRHLLALICLTGLYALAGFVLAPSLLRYYGPRLIWERTQQQAAVGEVRINPFLFTLEVNDFHVAEPGGQPFVGMQRLFCDLELKSLLNRAWTFSRLTLAGPLIKVVVGRDGVLNLARLLPPAETPARPAEEEQTLPRLIVEEIGIDQGEIGLLDERPSQPAAVRYQPLQLTIHNLTTVPGQEADITLTATGNGGDSLRAEGQLCLVPLRARGTVKVDSLPLATLFQFVRDAVALVPPQGSLALNAQYHLETGAGGRQLTLSGLDLSLEGLTARLTEGEPPVFELATMQLAGGLFDLSRRRFEVKGITVSGARTRLAVDEGGHLNVGRISKGSAAAPPPSVSPAEGGSSPWQIVLAGFNLKDSLVEYRDQGRRPEMRASTTLEAEGKAEAEFSAGGLRGSVSDLGLQAAEVKAELENLEQPLVRLDKINLAGGGLDLATKEFAAAKVTIQDGRIDLVRQDDGTINLLRLAPAQAQTTVEKVGDTETAGGPPARFLFKTVAVSGVDVVASDLARKPKAPVLNLQDIDLTLANVDGKSPMDFAVELQVEAGGRLKAAGRIEPLLPAVKAEVQVEDLNLVPAQPYLTRVAKATLKSGTISSTGSLRFGCEGPAKEGCQRYEGGVEVKRLRLTGEADDETLIGWQSLKTKQLKLDLRSKVLDLGDLKLTGSSGKVVIDEEHRLNLAQLIKSEPGVSKKPPAKPGGAAPFTYRVRRLLVDSGKVDFADFSLFTPFATKIHAVKGVVTGISSAKGARAKVQLDGQVDDYGTAKVKGELDASAPQSFTDVTLAFRNLEMARLTPYTGTFAGREIESGKLAVDLRYKIEAGELAGDNQFKVERLTLGDRIESPTAINLPLDLAVALLEDANGVIDLDLPVRGNLNSPEFSYGSIVGKAIASLIVNIVASPFRILGALLPGFGKEASLNAVAFEAGGADLPPPEREKLVKLAEALKKRPQLKLTVTGVYNPASDLVVLQARHVSRALAKILGSEIGPEEQEAFDFTSPETRAGLVALVKERLGGEAYKALQAEMKAETEAEQERALALADSDRPQPSAGARGDKDEGRFARLMFTRLIEGEKIEDDELVKLAEARAQAVSNELLTAGAVESSRLALRPAKELAAEAAIAVELNLEAGQ